MIFLKSFGAVFFLSIAVYLTLTINKKASHSAKKPSGTGKPSFSVRMVVWHALCFFQSENISGALRR